MLLACGVTLLSAAPAEKGKPMTHHASGTFEVKMEPIEGGRFARLAGTKQLHGDLEGTSASEMMSIYGKVEGSGAYAAIEVVTGTLGGRKGSFALVHSGTMRRGGDYRMIIRVVPDSGTEELTGIDGTLEIVIENGKHFYKLDYTLPAE